VTNAQDVIEELPTPVRRPRAAGSCRIGTAGSTPRGRPKSNRKKDLRAAQRRRIAPH
jgi:hypothetical protein